MVAKMKSFADVVNEQVKRSAAYSNSFFENCKDPAKQAKLEDVAEMATNWYLVTKHFGLSAPVYTGVLAGELRNAEGEKSRLLQHLLIESAMIAGDDLGLGHEQLYEEHGGADIPHNERVHYRLWGDMTKKIVSASENQSIEPNDIMTLISRELKREDWQNQKLLD